MTKISYGWCAISASHSFAHIQHGDVSCEIERDIESGVVIERVALYVFETAWNAIAAYAPLNGGVLWRVSYDADGVDVDPDWDAVIPEALHVEAAIRLSGDDMAACLVSKTALIMIVLPALYKAWRESGGVTDGFDDAMGFDIARHLVS